MNLILRVAWISMLVLAVAAPLRAQMTVSGRVTARGRSVAGASVRLADLGLETRTGSDGSFNLLIPSSRVLGQRVRIVARDRKYGTQAIEIALEGNPVVVEFNLGAPTQTVPGHGDTARAMAPVRPLPGAGPGDSSARPQVDSTDFLGASGSLDLASALAGRIPGLLVRAAAFPGASAPMLYRGPRSFTMASEPLVVVDGVPIDTRPFSRSERFGLGGFDYGTTIQDLALDDIATVMLLDGAAAAVRYGSRAANGVLLVTTKRAGNGGWEYSVGTRYLGDGLDRFPSFQNQFGQGAAGQFEFFDGAGGGINDDVAENWGPALQGQPMVQGSYNEPKRPDVRPWVPQSLNVRDYFQNGGTFDAHGAFGFGDDLSARHVRASMSARNAIGTTPGASVTRLSAHVGGSMRLAQRLSLNTNLQLARTAAEQRPGIGFDGINPMSQFLQMGRQVDLDSLRAHIVQGSEQINWIYTGFNNPWFEALRNRNTDDRTHALASAVFTYSFSDDVKLDINGAYDHADQHRDFDVAAGWQGGYPTALGRGDFSGGGSQRQTLVMSASTFGIALSAADRALATFTVNATVGGDIRSDKTDVTTMISDLPAAGSPVQANDAQSNTNAVSAAFASASATRGALTLAGGVRAEMPSTISAGGTHVKRSSSFFPMVSANYDVSAATQSVGLPSASLRASWWRAGNEVTARGLTDAYAGIDPTAAPTFGISPIGIAGPEMTTGVSVGMNARGVGDRVSVAVTGYRERTSDVVLVTPDIDGNAVTSQDGEITNSGVEASLDLVALRGEEHSWRVTASLAKNSNSVDVAGPGATTQVPLGPSFSGATLYAAAASPLGVIVGTRFLRDAAGALVLKNGLPMADQGGAVILGSIQPDWSASIGSRARIAGFELDVLVEARMGGRVFSATNRFGQAGGTLSETLAGRDTGLVIVGSDSVTGQPNTVNVSAESYFHALAGITEAFVYDASFTKLRDARLSYVLPLRFLAGFRDRTLRLSVMGRNLISWSKAPNMDSEIALSSGVFQGFEMGQLPGTKSFGVVISVTP